VDFAADDAKDGNGKHRKISTLFAAGRKINSSLAGLLTCPCFWSFPSSLAGQWIIPKTIGRLWPGFTAAGTVAGSHGIPFSFHPVRLPGAETSDGVKIQIFLLNQGN
jgi:hypothetical protein